MVVTSLAVGSRAAEPRLSATSNDRSLSVPTSEATATTSEVASAHATPELPTAPSTFASSGELATSTEGCAIDDPGPGSYRTVALGVAEATLHAPAHVPERYPLIVHFHGGEPVRRLLVAAQAERVFVTIDAGKGSQRYAALVSRELPSRLLGEVEAKLGRAPGKVVLSAWSAGYGAVREWLKIAPDTANAVLLLDAVHASYDGDGHPALVDLAPFVELAERATRGSPFVWLSHSSIVPPGYASTTEVADALLERTAARRRYAGLEAMHGVELRTRADKGALHVRGTTGGDPAAHCAHLRALPDVLAGDLRAYLER